MTPEKLATLVDGESVSELSEAAIWGFEHEFGVSLPHDFAFFQRHSRGGEMKTPLEMTYKSSLYRDGESKAGLERIYGIGRSDSYAVVPLSQWLNETERVVEGVPPEIFVFGEDLLGNQITIDLRPASMGQIGFVDHETVGDHFNDKETYRIIASSFSEFVSKLRLEK